MIAPVSTSGGCGNGIKGKKEDVVRMQRIRNFNRIDDNEREAHQPEDVKSPPLSQSFYSNETLRQKNIQIHSGIMWKTQNQMKSEQLLTQRHNSRSPVVIIRRSPSRRVNPIIRRFIQRRTK